MESINQTNKPNLNNLYRHCLSVLDGYYYDYADISEKSFNTENGRSLLADKLAEAIQEMITSQPLASKNNLLNKRRSNMEFKIVRFKYNGKFGLKNGHAYYDKELFPFNDALSIYKFCQFDTKEEVEDLLAKEKMEVDVLETVNIPEHNPPKAAFD